MNNTNNSSEDASDEQRHSIELQENSNVILNLSNSINVDKKSRKRRVTYKSILQVYWNIKSFYKVTFKTVLFTSIVMTIGILTVCLTAPKASKACQSSFKAVINGNSFQKDSNPHSVATGDFNHDNLLDIVVVNSGTNSIGIFLNYGNGTFVPQITFTTGDYSRPLSVAVADFNNDTHFDVAVTNYDTHNIGIFLGYGNGTFVSQITFPTGASRPVSIAVGDFNNDHRLDIVITNNGTNNIGILFGYGNGSFGNQITYSTEYDSLPYSVAVDDINNDHHLDIVVANYGTNNIGIFLGYGNGSFTTQITYSTSPRSSPFSVAINDFNDDGKLDIAVANSGTNNIGIFLGYGYGSFVSQTIYSISPGSNPHSIITGDFNQDNQLDIAVSNYDTNNISILIGYDNGGFATPTMHSTGTNSNPFGMTVGDFDNDNQSDIAVVNSATNNILLLIGYEMMQSENPTSYSTGVGSLPIQITMEDVDNDTQLDLIVANSGTNNVGVFLGYGNGSFREQITYSTGNNSRPYGITVNDLDNDHQLDIVVANSGTESVGILYGYGNGTFCSIVIYFTGDLSSPKWVTVNDFNNDNHLDIVFADYGTNSIGIFLGYGDRTFKNRMTYSTGASSHPFSISTGDFNNDNRLDIAVSNYGTDNIVIFIGSDSGTFTLFTTCSTGDNSVPTRLTTADLNKDNHLDIIVANYGTNNVGVFFGFGNGSFGTQMIYPTGSSSFPYWISVADLNNDHSLDIAVANCNSNNVGVLLGNSYGYFGAQTTYSTGTDSAPYSIGVGDFNKDNRLDIAVANSDIGNVAILLGHLAEYSKNQIAGAVDTNLESSSITANHFNYENQSNSTIPDWITNDVPILLGDYYANFRNQTIYSTGASSRSYSIAVGGLKNHTQMDLVIANSGNANLGIFLGYGNGTFATEMIYSIGIGFNPQNVIVNDFNNDNLLDVAVNIPINDRIIVLLGNGNGTFSTKLTYSTGSGSNPSALTIGNLNNDNYVDLVVANRGTDTIGIFFGFDYTSFGRQNPCETGESSLPSSVAKGDFNNDGYLDVVAALYGTSNVGVFLGYGNGTFTSMMTYSDVPASYPRWVAVGDFNNDNQLDITVANYGTDSISVVLGYGNGSFAKPLLYSTSFGSLPISVAVGDFNNDHYLDITTANYGGNCIGVFLGYGNGTFQTVIVFSTGKNSHPNSVTISDINNDTHLDIIVANEGISSIGVFLGYGDGSFAEQVISSTGTNTSPWYAVAADFNKDGRLDLAITNYGTSSIGILYGYGDGTFGNLQTYSTGVESVPPYLSVADFNNDNQLDIIVTDGTSTNVGVFFGYSDGTFTSISTVPIGEGSATVGVVVGDFNNDNRLDFIITDVGYSNMGVFLADGSKPFGGQTTFPIANGSHPSSVALGHFNNDNHFDIAIANSGTNNIGILLGYGNRLFSNMPTYSTGNDSNPMSLAIGDFNNDSLADIVVANFKADNIVVLMGYGNGSFSTLITYSTDIGSQPVSIDVGDFNRDYKQDIVVANFGLNNVCVLFGRGNGTFTNQTCYPLGYDSRPNWVIFKDLNNDGWEDIAVVTIGTDNIEILLNLC